MSLQNAVNQMLNEIENPDGGNVPVIFYEKARYNEAESAKTGKPIYELCVYVRKHNSNLNIYDQPARDNDIKQFPRQYEAFLKNKTEKEAGVPIGMLPAITPTELAICEACKVYTIEKLAQAGDVLLLDIGNPELKQRAIEYLGGESAKDKEIAKLKAELERLNDTTNNSTKRGGRNATVRESTDSNKQL
jgi:hypothetical protein